MKQVIGTMVFAVLLTVSPVAAVNAQNAAQLTPTPDVATKSYVRQATAKLAQKLEQGNADLKATLAAQTKAQADAQRAAEKIASDRQMADLKATLAAQAKAQADAQRTKIIGVIILVGICTLVVLSIRKGQGATSAARSSTTMKSPTPEDLYGSVPSPDQARQCLADNGLKECRFTIDLRDGSLFEYRAVVRPEGKVVAFFDKNDAPISLDLPKLRKFAAMLYDNGNGSLKPISLKSPASAA